MSKAAEDTGNPVMTISTPAYEVLKNSIVKYRRIVVTLLFLAQAVCANYLAFVIRFESAIAESYFDKFWFYLPFLLGVRLFFFLYAGLYKGLWRYASIGDLMKIIKSSTLGSITFLFLVHYLMGDQSYPLSIFILDWLLFILISGGSRLLIRVFKEYMSIDTNRKRILVVGAGDAAEMIVREMRNNGDHAYEPIGFVDENVDNKGLTIHDIPILGTCDMLPDIIGKYKPDEILIAGSGEMRKSIKEIYELCKPFNLPIKKLPDINDLLDGNVTIGEKLGQRLVAANLITEEHVREALQLQEKEGGRLGSKLIKLGYISEEKLLSFLSSHYGVSHMKPLSLSDLLQRDSVKTDNSLVKGFIRGKSVLVTGAGGSIGSELCRQIIKYGPSRLLLLDRYENSLHEVDIELRSEDHDVPLQSIIVDVQDRTALDHVFSEHMPQVIFHAAAYKHVPLMEHSPIEAVKNNVFGTKNLIEAASRHNAECFVLVSTDKAVNPTSIMGATKRIAEFLTLQMNSASKTRYTIVRFGNVLGSNGSVVPIFKEQLKNGGPITVTHPEIERFFMLIPEAVQLVLIAAATGKGGELFVLDMGSPIKIAEFAENFIRLAGFIPHKEIKIKYIGLRPGEKLYEELFDDTEQCVPTSHAKLMMAIPVTPPLETLATCIEDFERIVGSYKVDEVVPTILKVVPNFNGHRTRNGSADDVIDCCVH